MKIEIVFNEKQIKEACLDLVQEKFHGVKGMEFDIKSIDILTDGVNSNVSVTIIGED